MLYLISTPIGNLGDFSFRAVETVRNLDYLLCEDTRRTRILLNHYELKVPLKSFHAHSEGGKIGSVVKDLSTGMEVGLVSDAGTPGISDPGSRLVAACREKGIKVVPVPGACAAIAALAASGLDTARFQFFGFLPRKKGKLRRIFEEILTYPGTTICYESPFRLAASLKVLTELEPERRCVVARELTKKFEEFIDKSAAELLDYFSVKPAKGEIVLMICGLA
ncbi:MAG: 16S rRNA (cytidine(1402)-2'-O)-methyltransferase [Chlamydiales bacterium]|nr:16S rRNA (cytidine(1402)-2'-O)-methyltransferase [Chlamydiales bacterium]